MNHISDEGPASVDSIMSELRQALQSGNHPYLTPVIATRSASAYGANSRVVILRKATPEPAALEFHTNVGAAKVAELNDNPYIAWTFYNPAEGVQLRIYTEAALHSQNTLAREAWDELHPGSKKIYTIRKPSGSRINDPDEALPSNFSSRNLSHEMVEEGYAQFCRVQCPVRQIDWLKIDSSRHIRKKFVWQEQTGTFASCWVVP